MVLLNEPISLRAAQDQDLAPIVALINRAYRTVGDGASWNVETGVIEGPRISEANLRADLAAHPLAHLLVVGEVAQLSACVWLEPGQNDAWYLGLFAVAPKFQNQQLGRRFLTAAEQFARDRGAHQIRMSVLNVRDTLIAWYQRRGYQITSEIEAFPYGDERIGRPLRDDLHFLVLVKDLSSIPPA